MMKIEIPISLITFFAFLSVHPFFTFGQSDEKAPFLKKNPDLKKQMDNMDKHFKPNIIQFPAPEPLPFVKISIRIGNAEGRIRPLLGVNAGPIPCGSKDNPTLTKQYRWAGINMVRTHDFYGPLDLSVIYPDISKDPNDKFSYNFTLSDLAMQAIIDSAVGAEPYLRLGDSYNNIRVPHNKQERCNLIQAMLNVVRRYQGKNKEGFLAPIRYVEIGNEADEGRHFWQNGFEDYLEFFSDAFFVLKKEFPNLKIGGPSFTFASYKLPPARKNAYRFFDFVQKRNIPLDFISFHVYSSDPREYYDATLFFRHLAQSAGYKNVELHINEWNTERRNVKRGPDSLHKDAPYLTACWIALQEAEVDMSCIYRGTDPDIKERDFYGIFFADGASKPLANAFHLWSKLAQYPCKHKLETGIKLIDEPTNLNEPLKPLWALAGSNEKGETALLLVNIGNKEINYTVQNAKNIEEADITELPYIENNLKTYSIKNGSFSIAPLSIQFLRIKKIQK